jgi:hypothetical protein
LEGALRYTIYPGGKNVSADGEQKELFFENRPGTKFGSGTKFENFSVASWKLTKGEN